MIDLEALRKDCEDRLRITIPDATVKIEAVRRCLYVVVRGFWRGRRKREHLRAYAMVDDRARIMSEPEVRGAFENVAYLAENWKWKDEPMETMNWTLPDPHAMLST
jgi:hypothetical protein